MSYELNSEVNFLWSEPKIYIPKKLFNYKLMPCVEKGYDWYVYYYYKNPFNGKLERFTEELDINTFKTVNERFEYGKNLQKAVSRYLINYNPYEEYENKKPNEPYCKIHIPRFKVDQNLIADSKSTEWFIFVANGSSNFLEIPEVYNGDKEDINERIISLKRQANELIERINEGYNPFEKKVYSISNEEFEHFKQLKRFQRESSSKREFDFEVFKSLNTQKIFHKLLLKENVIDSKNHPKKRFQTVVYNAFKCRDTLHYQIFNNRKLNLYVKFLETQYNFTKGDKSKFANEREKIRDKIASFFESELKVR